MVEGRGFSHVPRGVAVVQPHLPVVHIVQPEPSHKVFTKSFCESQFPHKSVNLSFGIAHIKNKLTDLYEN